MGKFFVLLKKVYFSGNNAAHFYKSIKIQPLNLDIFDFQRTSVARFDINYLTELKTTNQTESIKTFMTKSCQKTYAKSKRRKAAWNINRKGLLLTIGSRSSSNYYRVYQSNNGLKFELEIKNKGIRSFQDLLFSYRIEEFEDRLAKYFYYQSFELLNLDTKYTNWLIHRFRTLYPKQRHSCLMTSYLRKYSQRDFKDQEKIFNLFRILFKISVITNRSGNLSSLNSFSISKFDIDFQSIISSNFGFITIPNNFDRLIFFFFSFVTFILYLYF